mgnify:CR=1 FL=1
MKIALTISMLVVSNVFMTWAWYGHLKKGSGADDKPLLMIILMSWGLAFFEYCFMIPANRLGSAGGLNVAQLKIMQEVITLCVFIPFALFYIGEKWKWDYLWAFLCVLGAVFFVNRLFPFAFLPPDCLTLKKDEDEHNSCFCRSSLNRSGRRLPSSPP